MIIARLAAYAALDEGSYKIHNTSAASYLGNLQAVDAAMIRSLSVLATTLALVYCHKHDHQPTQPQKDGSINGNLLLTMRIPDDEHTENLFRKTVDSVRRPRDDIVAALACDSRMGGAMTHWREAMQQTPVLWRPRQLYMGAMPGFYKSREPNGHRKV